LRDGPNAISHKEFVAWIEFYRLYPFDDRHRFHRPAAMVAHAMGGADVSAILEYLQPSPDPMLMGVGGRFSDADLTTLSAFGKKGGH
jgi:hypothetical protein